MKNEMTVKDLKAKLSAVGVSLKYDEGEYRVCVRGGSEATAYYTNNKEDAYRTGLTMAPARYGLNPAYGIEGGK